MVCLIIVQNMIIRLFFKKSLFLLSFLFCIQVHNKNMGACIKVTEMDFESSPLLKIITVGFHLNYFPEISQ